MEKNEPNTLTVGQAKDLLQRIIDDRPDAASYKLFVPYVSTVATLGAIPSIGVSQISVGFDWDTRKVFINPEELLGEPVGLGKKRLQELEKLRSEVYWLLPRILERDDISSDQKLEMIKKRLDARKQSS